MEQRTLIVPLSWKIQQTKSPIKSAKHHHWWQALDRAFSFLWWVIKRKKGIKFDLSKSDKGNASMAV